MNNMYDTQKPQKIEPYKITNHAVCNFCKFTNYLNIAILHVMYTHSFSDSWISDVLCVYTSTDTF